MSQKKLDKIEVVGKKIGVCPICITAKPKEKPLAVIVAPGLPAAVCWPHLAVLADQIGNTNADTPTHNGINLMS
jgi:hypothetical protein